MLGVCDVYVLLGVCYVCDVYVTRTLGVFTCMLGVCYS